jgi:uncharacterized membrane protein
VTGGSKLSADQTPPAPPETLPRLFFPDQPAVPPPPPGQAPPPVRPVPARPQGRPTGVPRRELRQQALAATVFGLLSLLALTAANQAGHAIYLVVFALLIGAVAAVLGISAGRRAHREGAARPRGSVAGIVLGVVSVILALMALVVLTFSRQFASYEQCVNNATTPAAQQACTHQLLQAVQSRYGQHP